MTEKKNFHLKNFIDNILTRKYLPVVYLVLTAVSILALALIQPFGDPPDEINRFKVVYYIANHGTLPNGYAEEILLDGYGGSYAFQPILSYILMGYLIRFMKLFTQDSYSLLVAARMVNLVLGVVMAYYVMLIGRKLWKDPVMQWLFALMITFLPMNIFMHSYVNTDSMALLSCAMMVYGMLLGEENDYDQKTCILLGVGAVLCAMSYYNAYGIVLMAILWFTLHFARKRAWKKFFQKGGLIAAIILLGAGWWFVRNGILYGGDFLGMDARLDCAIQTAMEEYNPLTRFTFYGAGLPISAVFAEKQYAWVTFESLIAMFGPMNIPTHGLIYIYYKRLVIVALAGALLPIGRKKQKVNTDAKEVTDEKENAEEIYWDRVSDHKTRLLFGGLMLLDCFITMGLHLYYSYTWEYQPQGRYLLPMIVSAGYLMCMGIWKIGKLLELASRKLFQNCGNETTPGTIFVLVLQGILVAFIFFTLFYTLCNRVLPVYLNGTNLMQTKGVPFTALMDWLT